MKNFLKENWFKLMTGTSMLVFSFAFLLYAVSPSYANKTSEIKKPQIDFNDYAFLVESDGYLYSFYSKGVADRWCEGMDANPDNGASFKPHKRKLP